MIWIKNHGIRGESDNLRMPLADEVDEVTCHQNDPDGCPAIAKVRGWTGVCIKKGVGDVRDGFEGALGSQLRFAVDEPADHGEFDDKAEELDAYHDGEHPDIDND